MLLRPCWCGAGVRLSVGSTTFSMSFASEDRSYIIRYDVPWFDGFVGFGMGIGAISLGSL